MHTDSYAAAGSRAILATADQRGIELRALIIFSSPEVRAQIETSKELLLGSRADASPEAYGTLQEAVAELAFAAVLGAANEDPTRPKVVWTYTARRAWLGREVPGSRGLLDSPDNVYRFIPIDVLSKYEISSRIHLQAPVQFSFFACDSFLGSDTPIAGFRDSDINVGPDGGFEITIDSLPANGRVNHIQSTPEVRYLLVRNTLSDWSREVPLEITVKRVGGPPPGTAQSDAELAKRAAELLKMATQTLLSWQEKHGAAAELAPNTISKPFVRGGGWGFATYGNYRIADDEALVVTLDPIGARYLGFQVTDPWVMSREHIHAASSLNNNQAEANKDGTYTYVVAARDPGVSNWVDTVGLHAGHIFIRWQALPQSVSSADAAVRDVKLVRVQDLKSVLPAETRTVTASERHALSKQRAAEYSHRYSAQSSDDTRL